MKAKDMREKSAEDLRDLEKSLTHDHFLARLKNFTNRLDDTSSIRRLRRDIARVKTLLGEMVRGGKAPVALPKRAAPKPAASKPAVSKAAPSKPAAPKAAASASQLPKKAAESKSKVAAPSKPAAKKRTPAKKSESK